MAGNLFGVGFATALPTILGLVEFDGADILNGLKDVIAPTFSELVLLRGPSGATAMARNLARGRQAEVRVYHFLRAAHALDDIAKRRIKISEIDQTNDPFELWCVSQPNRTLRDALRAYKKEMSERFGLICFSEDWVNPLLWSHYADKHRGICLGFDVDERGLRKVTYAQ